MTIKSPIKYPSGEDHPEVYIPMGNARYQQWWCHQMIDQYDEWIAWKSELITRMICKEAITSNDPIQEAKAIRSFYKKKLLKELYRKEYYEGMGWDFTFRVFNITVVEIGPWMRTYHGWVGVKGEKFTIQLPRVKA